MRFPLRLMLLSVAMMLLGFSARAGSITREQAKAKAQSFLQAQHQLQGTRRLAPARTPVELTSTPTGEAALYVFNIGEQDGFVIVSGDDRTRSILGYADRGTFDADRVPAALSEMLAIYARQIEQLVQSGSPALDSLPQAASKAQARRRISGTMADVKPLLTTTWDQGDPYNAYCPTLDDQTALTGCVATAMAQIAYYHRYPTTQVPNLAAYTSATNKINVSAWGATTFDWDNMLPSYGGSYSNTEKTAVATLMRYCGQAAQMDYGFTSGAYNGDALNAFTQKLGYNANATFRSAASYSANGWEDLIYKEVSENRPVYYSALNGDDGGPQCGGHAFVIDGYRADGNYFHVNWGWGGAYNGYFNLFALDPGAPESPVTSTGWHYQMLALVGLSPETVNTAKLTKDAAGSWLITSTDDWNELSANLDAYNGGSFKLTQDISVTTMVGTEWQPFSGTFDGQGHTLNVNIESNEEYVAPFHWAVGATFRSLTVAGTINVTEHFAGGLIGWADEVTLQGCESKVTINSNYWGDGTHGGFISIVRGGTARFYDCVFSGAILGEHTYCCGGFCGWRDGDVEMYNCLNIGRFELESIYGSATFCRNGTSLVNSYYINNVDDNQGTAVTTEQLASGTITRALQDGTRDWTTDQVWGQLLGTDDVPQLTSDASKGVYKVSFAVDGQVVKTVFTNSPIGDKMPMGEDFGLTNATFTANGAPFTSTTPLTGDVVVTVTGTSAYTLTLGTPANGTISINNNTCMPGTLKKVTALPASGYVVKAVTAKDASGNALPMTPVSNNANEFVFTFPKSSVTVSAEFEAGEAEAVRFINGGMTLPSSWRSGNQPWTADTWMIWGKEYDGTDNVIVGAPPVDALGHQWYEEGYALTNSDADVLPNGNKIVWENHAASFRDGGNYDYFQQSGAPGGDINGDFYIRRIFTFNSQAVPTKLYMSCSYDDAPVEYYINGTLVYEDQRAQSWFDDNHEIELTPAQIALIHTDGTPNVLAVHASQNWGGYHLDCGLYDPTAFSYEVTGEQTVRLTANHFIMGDVVIPETVTANGVNYTVTEMEDDATNDLPYMTSMSIPATITRLGTDVFWNNPLQEWVKSYIPVIQHGSVLVAAPLTATEYELDEGCQRIWNNAFKFTEQLTTLTLPRSLAEICSNAFVGCTALKDIYSYARPVPQTERNAFDGIDKSKITVHVYESALDSYKQSWGEEFQYVTTPDPQPITLTIDVTDRGSLYSLVEAAVAEKGGTLFDVTGITVTGNINQDDLRTLAAMCTGVYTLATIDLSGASIEDNYIDNNVFRDHEKLTSITLPESLELIGDAAFHNCDGLTSIDIPASVKRMEGNAFSYCDNLSIVTGMEGLTFAWDPFYATAITQPVCGGTVFLYMPPNVTGEYEMPAGIKMTAAGSMRGSQLSSIILPASLTDIDDDTFQDCHNLIDIYCYAATPPVCHGGVWEWGFDRSACTVHVPASAVEDYKNADEWRDMGRIVGFSTGELVDMSINVATAGTLNDALFDAAVAAAQITDKLLIRNLTVTGNINTNDVAYLNSLPATLYNMYMLDLSGATLVGNAITERMFYQALYKAIKLPANVTSIASEAFAGSRRLQSVSIPNAVTTIESNTFSECSSLSDVSFGENSVLKRIEESAFNGLTSLKSITLPESLEYIGPYAFAGSGLTSITIPDNVVEVGHRSLQSCGSLTSIIMGEGMTTTPDCWAEYSNNLESVTIGSHVTFIWWRSFYGANIKDVYCYGKMPPAYDNEAFYDVINSEAVLHVYSNCVNRYQNANGWQAFPNIVGDLGTYPTIELAVNVPAFGGFSNALASAMTAAGCEDMSDITKLTVTGKMNIDDLNYLRDNVGRTLDILDLSSVTVENNALCDGALAGCVFDELLLPISLELIQGWSVLEGCVNLKTIDIPGKVRYMGPVMLNGATSLETVTGGNGMTDIDRGNGTFFDRCPNLKSAVIFNSFFVRLPLSTTGGYEVPAGVTTIVRNAMWNVSGLTALTLPESITSIYSNAFARDNNLKDIYYYAVELPYTDWAFNDFDCSACTLHVYEEMVDLFKNDEMWSEFNIVGDLGTMPVITPMNEADYADLCNLYNTLGGESWRSKWITNNNVQTASRWRGVTFDDEGYVTSIDLRENGLSGDISELAFTGMSRLTSLNLSSNALTGDIQTLASSLPRGCRLNVERQDLGYVGELTLYEACSLTNLPSIAFWQSESSSLASTLMGVGGYCQFYHPGTDGKDYWDCYIHADGWTESYNKFYWPSPTTMECFYPQHFTFTYKYMMGDANMDDVVNVLDLQSTLNYSNNQQEGLFNFYAADTYAQDDDINVQDIVSTVNILQAQDVSGKANVRARDAANPTDGEACLLVEDGQIVLYSAVPVAALDLRLSGISPEDISWSIEENGFTTATTSTAGGTHAIIYSLQPRQMEEGRTVLATFDATFGPRITSAMLSDSNARPVGLGSTIPTDIRTIDHSPFTIDHYYNLAGQRVGKSYKGIVVENGKKVITK